MGPERIRRARFGTSDLTAERPSAAPDIHKTTIGAGMAEAFAALPCWDGRDAPAGGPCLSVRAPKLGSPGLVPKDVVQLVGLVVELADYA